MSGSYTEPFLIMTYYRCEIFSTILFGFFFSLLPSINADALSSFQLGKLLQFTSSWQTWRVRELRGVEGGSRFVSQRGLSDESDVTHLVCLLLAAL